MNKLTQARMQRTSNGGFTLIEVLVAVVVLAIGILGVAALQTASIGQGKGSLQAVQANALAMDLADRIRANSAQAYLGNYRFDNTNGASGTTTDQNCNTNSGTITVCTGLQMAKQDLYNWYKLASQQLPSPTVQVNCPDNTCTSVVPQTMTIIIYWNENKNTATGSAKLTDLNCGTSAYDPMANLPCVVLAFQP